MKIPQATEEPVIKRCFYCGEWMVVTRLEICNGCEQNWTVRKHYAGGWKEQDGLTWREFTYEEKRERGLV